MRIPEVQERLRELATEHKIPELAQLATHLNRRSPKKRAPSKSTQITEAVRDQIRAYAASNPKLSQLEIGQVFNVNPGRVSEALRGFRS